MSVTHLLCGFCGADLATASWSEFGPEDEGGVRWRSMDCPGCGAEVYRQADRGSLDIGIVRA